MPTKPLEAILYRELSVTEGKEIIEIASPLLRELVNYGTNALVRCASSTSGRIDEDVAALALYKHIVETTDGIEVLLSQSCVVPSIPLLRSAFEALLAIEYIIQNEIDYRQRSLAWLVGYIHKRLDMYDRLDPTTNKGAEAKILFDADQSAAPEQLPPVVEVQKAKANLQAMLSKPHIQPVEAEYQRCIQKHRKSPEWYKLFSGPNDLRTLANELKRGWQYELLYRQWSTSAHAQDFLPFMERSSTGGQTIKRMRDFTKIREVASYACVFILSATRKILKKWRPEEDVAIWFKRDVQERYHAITYRSQQTEKRLAHDRS